MSGVGEELSAFDEEVCSSFLTLSVEEINTMRDPPDRPGQTRLRQAALSSLSNKCMPGWPTKTYATASHLQSVTRCSIGTSSQPPRIRRCTRHPCGVCRNRPGSNGPRGSDADGGWVSGNHTRERPYRWRSLEKRRRHLGTVGRSHDSLLRGGIHQ